MDSNGFVSSHGKLKPTKSSTGVYLITKKVLCPQDKQRFEEDGCFSFWYVYVNNSMYVITIT